MRTVEEMTEEECNELRKATCLLTELFMANNIKGELALSACVTWVMNVLHMNGVSIERILKIKKAVEETEGRFPDEK
jgi:hypothetical protein